MMLKIIQTLLVLIIFSSIYPVYYKYSNKKIPPLPPYNTYEQVILKILPEKIREFAGEKKCSGYILPMLQVNGQDGSFSSLKDELNLALASYRGWKLVVSPGIREQMKTRFEKNIASWGNMFSGNELMNILNLKKDVISKTNTSATAKWFYMDGTAGDNVRIVLTVNDELTTSKVFEIALTFIHNDKLSELKSDQEAQKSKLSSMKDLNDLSLKFLYSFSSILFLLLIAFGGQAVIHKGRHRQASKFLLSEINKREELVKNGHFVTAHDLAEDYLRFFPDDTDVRAFHQRLLDFTNNDPKTAQMAYVEAKKLKLKLTEYAGNPVPQLISGKEKENLKALLPYNKDLDAAFNQALMLEEENRRITDHAQLLNQIRESISSGYPERAQKAFKDFIKIFPDDPEIIHWRNELGSFEKECQERYTRVQNHFKNGNIRSGINELNFFLKEYKDFSPAVDLGDEIQNNREKSAIRLILPISNKPLYLFFKEEIEFGRTDDNIRPDVSFDDRRVSRNHLTIRKAGRDVEIIDNGSTGGTYIDGQKINSAFLKNGSVLNLAKIKEYKAILCKGENESLNGLFLSGPEAIYAMIFSGLFFNLNENGMDNKQEAFFIFYEDETAVLSWKTGFSILSANKNITTDAGIFKTEELS